jgi:hypothetical protein
VPGSDEVAGKDADKISEAFKEVGAAFSRWHFVDVAVRTILRRIVFLPQRPWSGQEMRQRNTGLGIRKKEWCWLV